MDLALTFHIGLTLRIPRTAEPREDDVRILPFGPVWATLGNEITLIGIKLGLLHDPRQRTPYFFPMRFG
jgi:hypothetical protein